MVAISAIRPARNCVHAKAEGPCGERSVEYPGGGKAPNVRTERLRS